MKDILFKVTTFCKTYKKRIITIVASGILAILIIGGISGWLIYSRANSNIKYSQEQLEDIALAKIPGDIVDVEKELNFRSQSYEYEFKIKDKNNMLQEIKVNSKYGTISADNHKENKKENGFRKDKRNYANKEDMNNRDNNK